MVGPKQSEREFSPEAAKARFEDASHSAAHNGAVRADRPSGHMTFFSVSRCFVVLKVRLSGVNQIVKNYDHPAISTSRTHEARLWQ